MNNNKQEQIKEKGDSARKLQIACRIEGGS